MISEICEILNIIFRVFEPIKLASLSKRMGEKAFFEENENKMI